MIVWTHLGREAEGRLHEKPDVTVFLAQHDGDGWLLWGAFIPDAEEPAKCKTMSDVKQMSEFFWLEFRRQVCPICSPVRR